MSAAKLVYSVHGPAPHIRHIATVNEITYPVGAFSTGAPVITGEIAVTVCGRILRDVWNGENVSTQYTDGSIYMIDCPTCVKRRAEAVERFGAFLVPPIKGFPAPASPNGEPDHGQPSGAAVSEQQPASRLS